MWFIPGRDEPLGFDRNESPRLDGVTRPSLPYLPPGHGFGHAGFAAICVTHHSAERFCVWLSDGHFVGFRIVRDFWRWGEGPPATSSSRPASSGARAIRADRASCPVGEGRV